MDIDIIWRKTQEHAKTLAENAGILDWLNKHRDFLNADRVARLEAKVTEHEELMSWLRDRKAEYEEHAADRAKYEEERAKQQSDDPQTGDPQTTAVAVAVASSGSGTQEQSGTASDAAKDPQPSQVTGSAQDDVETAAETQQPPVSATGIRL